MLQAHTVEVPVGHGVLVLETGKIGRQAHGAIMARFLDNVVLAAAVEGGPSRFSEGGAALTVDYREKTSAAGKFPGGFIKREGRPSTKEILTARLIDRPLRPLFPDAYGNEVAVNVLVLSADGQNDTDILSINACSAALWLSGMPIKDPIGAIRMGLIDGEFIVNPTVEQLEESELNITVAGTKHGITMVESGSAELSEDTMLEAIQQAHKEIVKIIGAIEQLRAKCGRPVTWVEPEPAKELVSLAATLEKEYKTRIREAHFTNKKHERAEKMKALVAEIVEKHVNPDNEDSPVTEGAVKDIFHKIETAVIREGVLKEGKRADGRGLTGIRPIECEVSFLPRVHGSALFTRGETQAIVSVTLGTDKDSQLVDGLEESYDQKFMLHYNFPAWCVGEAWPNRGPKRREIGHGALAERALSYVLPPEDDFPYTIRITSDVTESNGSSSMASVCCGTLGMMDAGIPIRSAVAGIAMGLVCDNGKVAILSDILGTEDHCGDMDFKVAGTRNGITALQMDIKIDNLSFDIIRKALTQAREGRFFILDQMEKVLAAPRPEISPFAPKIERITINPEKIGMVIGPGGKNVRGLQERTGTVIELDDDGTVLISGTDLAKVREASDYIKYLTMDPEIGKIYDAKVVDIRDFGAFVEFLPGQEGLVHVSEMAPFYIENVKSVVKEGERFKVKLVEVDDQGRVRLSRKAAEAELGIESTIPPSAGGSRGDRGDRGDRGGRDRGGRGGDRGGRDRGGRGGR